MTKEKRIAKCPNFNHYKLNVLVRYCCDCGELFNDDISKKKCTNESHAQRRRDRSRFCVDCGEKLENASR